MDEQTLLRKIDETCASVGMDAYLDGVIWEMPAPGVKARVSTIQSPLVNAVGMATFTEANVDEGIQHIINLYRQEEKIFGWFVGPTSQPANLGERLLAAGLIKLEEEAMWGMVLRDINQSIAINPAIRVEQVALTDWEANRSMLARAFGFGMTEEIINMLARYYESLGEQARVYLAYAPDREAAIAFAASIFDQDGSVVTLGGAATLEEYRGQGIYSTMVAKRLQDARALGITTAIIQAVKTTSAPICAKLGFEIVCPIDHYALLG